MNYPSVNTILSFLSYTHVRRVKPKVIPSRVINCNVLKRSRALSARHVKTHNMNRKTLADRGTIDMDINVIANEEYDPMKSDNCKPSYLMIQNR